jgi:hypothetical protein
MNARHRQSEKAFGAHPAQKNQEKNCPGKMMPGQEEKFCMATATQIEPENNSSNTHNVDALIIAQWLVNSRESVRVSIETLLVAREPGLVGDELPSSEISSTARSFLSTGERP